MDKIVLCLIVFTLMCMDVEARVRFKIRTKPECREKGPRRTDELPQVVFTGFVEQLYPSEDDGETYSGSVVVKRVFRGKPSLQSTRVTVGGFGTPGLCHSNVRKRDTWIFLLNPISEGFLKLNTTLLKVTLPNLDRINALVKGIIQYYYPLNHIILEFITDNLLLIIFINN